MSVTAGLMGGIDYQAPYAAMGLSDLEVAAYEGPTGGYVGLFFEPGSDAELAEATELDEPINPTGKALST